MDADELSELLYGDAPAPAADEAMRAPAAAASALAAVAGEVSLTEMRERVRELEAANAQLADKLRASERKAEALAQQKEVLLRNISCLFKTAQEELQRKQRAIDELRGGTDARKRPASAADAPSEPERPRKRP